MKQLHIELPVLSTDMQDHLSLACKKLELIQEKIKKSSRLQSDYAFAYAVDDEAIIKLIKNTVIEKQKLKPAMLIVIGIGGSNLGTLAVQEAVLGLFHNEHTQGPKIYYADTVDTDYICSILELSESTLKSGSQVMLNVVSKSGSTTETIALFELFLAQLKKYRPDTYNKYIVCTTDNNSALDQLANQHHWTTLTIPAPIGGRYSVFTAVGLFPLAMLGIGIDDFITGAYDMRNICLEQSGNCATLNAAWQHALIQKNYNITNLFLFSNELRGCGLWWRQLIGESLGKAKTLNGTLNKTALVPTVSVGTTDLHSVGQLYFADITKIATQFVRISNYECILTLPNYAQDFERIVPDIQEKTVAHIMHAVITGVQKAYTHNNMPFCTITLPEKNAYYVGQFLMLKMFETVYLACLLDVNPFDQPEVEMYKKEVRAILAKK